MSTWYKLMSGAISSFVILQTAFCSAVIPSFIRVLHHSRLGQNSSRKECRQIEFHFTLVITSLSLIRIYIATLYVRLHSFLFCFTVCKFTIYSISNKTAWKCDNHLIKIFMLPQISFMSTDFSYLPIEPPSRAIPDEWNISDTFFNYSERYEPCRWRTVSVSTFDTCMFVFFSTQRRMRQSECSIANWLTEDIDRWYPYLYTVPRLNWLWATTTWLEEIWSNIGARRGSLVYIYLR